MRLFGAFSIIVALFVALAVVQPTAAADGSVSIVPASSNVIQGDTVDVNVVVEPPPVGVSIWIIRVAYDPSVVQFVSCTVAPDPDGGGGPIAYAADCQLAPAGDIVTFGGWVQNVGGTAHGFETTQVLATITFKAIGPAGSQSPLHLTVQSMLSPNGQELHPALNDGVIHVILGPVGGSVEMVSYSGGGVQLETTVLAAASASIFAACIALLLRRRIIRR